MNVEADYSSGWSSSEEETRDSKVKDIHETATKNMKLPSAMDFKTSRNGPNNTSASLASPERVYLNERDGGSHGLPSTNKNKSRKDDVNESRTKRLKTDDTSTNATSVETENLNGKDFSLGLSASSNKNKQLNVKKSAQKSLEDNSSRKSLKTADNTTTRANHDSTLQDERNKESDSSDLSSSDSEPAENVNVTQRNTGDLNDSAAPVPAEHDSEAEDNVGHEPPVYRPAFLLGPMGEAAHVDFDAHERMPLFFTDVKELLAFAGAGINHAPMPGAWWRLSREQRVPQTVLVLIEGLAFDDFVSYRDCFPSLDRIFPSKLEVVTPAAYDGSFVEELVLVPMSRGKQKGLLRNYSCLEGALLRHNNLFGYVTKRKHYQQNEQTQKLPSQGDNHKYRCFLQVLQKRRSKALEAEKTKRLQAAGKKVQVSRKEKPDMVSDKVYKMKQQHGNLPLNDRFPRTQLIMSREQHISEGIPTPLGGCFKDRYVDYVPTKDLYAAATVYSPMFAIDCEMVETTAGGGILELARVSIVDESLKCIYDELVKPDNPVTNYLTTFSGITAKLLADVTKKLGDVHRELRTLLPMDAILVGHSICNDLHALRMVHPYLIDTSVIFNANDNVRCKAKLSTLSQLLLGETIQAGKGHCSTEDSRACMKLVQLKLSKDIVFGDTMLESNTTKTNKHEEEKVRKAVDRVVWEEFPLTAHRKGFAVSRELAKCRVVVAEKLSREIQRLDLTGSTMADMKKNWMLDIVLADPLFGLLKFVGKSAALIGTSDVIERHNQFKPEVRTRLDQFVKVFTAKDTRDVFEQVTKTLRYQFVVGHAHFDAKVVESAKPEEKKQIFSAIDASCKKIWDGVAEDGLCVVVFGGRERGNNGLCFVRLNNDVKEIIKSTPRGPEKLIPS